MQFKHSKTIVSASDGIQKITAVTWSPNNRKIAAVSTKGVIFLYDEQGEQRDKITTKPAQDKVSIFSIFIIARDLEVTSSLPSHFLLIQQD